MSRFFNKIRQSMLVQGRIARYLTYAVGEILLVVVGILIALQVNNYNAALKTAARNKSNLKSLAEELHSNQDLLKRNIETVKRQMSYTLNLTDTLSKELVPSEEREQFLHQSISKLGPLYSNALSTTTLRELVESGGFSEIGNATLKERILLYESQIQEMEEYLASFRKYWQDMEVPYLLKHYSVLDMWMTNPHVNPKKTEERIGHPLPDFHFGETYFAIEQEAFFGNRQFASMYINRFFELNSVLSSLELLETTVAALIEEIENAQ